MRPMATAELQIAGLTPDSSTEEPRTLFEAAYRQLRRDIINGKYLPGHKLRVEHLKSVYQVSAGTLREALALLVSDSLVVSQGQRGCRVAPMSLGDLEDLTRTRVLIECAALRDSIALGDDAWEARVVSSFHRLELAEGRLQANPEGMFEAWEERNRDFHETLISACRSNWMHRLRGLLYQQTERYRRFSAVNAPFLGVQDEHRKIFEAVMARDVDTADRALATHINHALEAIRRSGFLASGMADAGTSTWTTALKASPPFRSS